MESMGDKETLYQELIDVLNGEKLQYDEELLKRIFEYANNVYKDSKRYRNESTFSHALHVAEIVAKLKIGIVSVYAALLHEVPKFESYNASEFEKLFGGEIANLVKDSSELYLLNYDGQKEAEAEKLRKMFMAIAKDIRVVIMKLADRLYNMRNIYEEPESFQRLKANETMHVYAPIAQRLGMSEVKSELEDISFNILNHEEYERIRQIVEVEKGTRQEYINKRIQEIKVMLEKENIKATIYGRPKYYYSIFKKTKKNNCRVEDLFDLYAIRIIVDSVKECYEVLGIIHQNYKPMPGRFKDYISVPKTNMYQSLHTTLFGDGEAPFEIQIRTWKMHEVAEYGVAAHFLYKEGSSSMTATDEKLTWIRKTLELEQEMGDGKFDEIKGELFGDEVFVFTPKGEIKSFPKGSTTIDYAYSIHQHIGEKMIGAKINGKMVPIVTKLKNSDVIEIVTSKTSSGPKLDWLKSVKTTSAKNKIQAYIKKQGKELNREKGEELFEKETIKQGLVIDKVLEEKNIKVMLDKLNFKTLEDCFEAIGTGAITPKRVINKLVEDIRKEDSVTITPVNKPKRNAKSLVNDGIEVKGISDCLVKFARCCNPLPGDSIVGYITIGKGVSVHRADCPNLVSLDIAQRRIDVNWKSENKALYAAKIIVTANDRTGITVDILKLLQENKIKILGFTGKTMPNNSCEVDISLEVNSVDNLQKVIKEIKKIDSVYDVKRAK